MNSSISDLIKKDVDHIVPKANKYALKLIGIDNSSATDEEVLEFLSEFILPSSINALIYDFHNNFYTVFLSDIEAACSLINKKLSFGAHKVDILPLLDFYIVNNVYPSLSNEDIADIFRTFGNVYEVSNFRVLPNSSKFSHILSGKREISFLLPGDHTEVPLPRNVISLPFTFHVKKLCCACLTEGHSVLSCPDIEDCSPLSRNLSLPSIEDADIDAEELSLALNDKDAQLENPFVCKVERGQGENSLAESTFSESTEDTMQKKSDQYLPSKPSKLLVGKVNEESLENKKITEKCSPIGKHNEKLINSRKFSKLRTKITPRRQLREGKTNVESLGNNKIVGKCSSKIGKNWKKKKFFSKKLKNLHTKIPPDKHLQNQFTKVEIPTCSENDMEHKSGENSSSISKIPACSKDDLVHKSEENSDSISIFNKATDAIIFI